MHLRAHPTCLLIATLVVGGCADRDMDEMQEEAAETRAVALDSAALPARVDSVTVELPPVVARLQRAVDSLTLVTARIRPHPSSVDWAETGERLRAEMQALDAETAAMVADSAPALRGLETSVAKTVADVSEAVAGVRLRGAAEADAFFSAADELLSRSLRELDGLAREAGREVTRRSAELPMRVDSTFVNVRRPASPPPADAGGGGDSTAAASPRMVTRRVLTAVDSTRDSTSVAFALLQDARARAAELDSLQARGRELQGRLVDLSDLPDAELQRARADVAVPLAHLHGRVQSHVFLAQRDSALAAARPAEMPDSAAPPPEA